MTVTNEGDVDLRDVIFWTDNMNILYWTRNQSRLFKSFVANRVRMSQTHTKPSQWRYIGSKLNPAEKITRAGMFSEQYAQVKFLVAWSRVLCLYRRSVASQTA